MSVKELYATVDNWNFSALLPAQTLIELVEPLEHLVGLPGLITIHDSDAVMHYGTAPCGHPPISAPVVVNGTEIGLVGICATSDQAQDTADYLGRTLSMLAQETLRRREMSDEVLERYDELNLIYDLVALISSNTLSQTEIVQAVLGETNRILGAEIGVLYLYDEDQSQLVPISYFGRRSDEQFWQGRTRELALSTLYAYDSTQLFENSRVICAPLRYNDERLGALVLMHETSGATFSANDVNLLTTLSHNTALFVQAARLWDSLARQNAELEQALADLKSARDELGKAERLSLIGQIVGGLVHDMRNPLNIVMGYAGMMQEGGLTEAEVSEYATQVITYVDTFSSMAQEILDYARDDEKVDRKPVNVGDYMRYIEGLLTPPGLKRSVKIRVECQAAGYRAYLDSQRYSRIFQNLVNNAIDAIEEHGGSQVVVRAEPGDGDQIRFSVSDDGPGVMPEIAQRLFEPLVTSKAHGTGLGLAIVRRMVTIHDGTIHYETAPEGGASFVFTAPQA
jgi:signal transduction histidine kinase